MKKIKILLFDLFFIISSIIGVGFATGKEIAHFFVSGKSVVIATIIFFVVFASLCWYFLYIKQKHNVKDLTHLNKLAFGKYYEVGNIVLVILFIVTNAAMLAGCDNLVRTYLGINIPFMSLFLSAVTFFIALGNVNRIKLIANIVMPALVSIIIINAGFNFNTSVNLSGSVGLDFIYPIIFCCENFITLIAVIICSKSSAKSLSLTSGFVVSIIILLSAFAVAGSGVDMPMLTLSKNLGDVFFMVYLIGVIFALFTTLEISTYNCLDVVNKNKSNRWFTLLIIILVGQIIAYLGFSFIVKYLYTAIGILGAIYLIALIINLIIFNKKFK